MYRLYQRWAIDTIPTVIVWFAMWTILQLVIDTCSIMSKVRICVLLFFLSMAIAARTNSTGDEGLHE
jgi:hypothetical protein